MSKLYASLRRDRRIPNQNWAQVFQSVRFFVGACGGCLQCKRRKLHWERWERWELSS